MRRDQKPASLFFPQDEGPITVHHMVVDLVMDPATFVITSARTVMETHPHEVCRVVEAWLRLEPAQVKIRFDADKTTRDADLTGDVRQGGVDAAAVAAAATSAKAGQRPVIAGENHQRASLNPKFFQPGEQASHLTVIFIQHRAKLSLFPYIRKSLRSNRNT